MAISYSLFENHLTSDPADYAAHVQIVASVDLDGIAQRMIDQGSTVTKPDILAVLEDAIKACESLLLEGNRINFAGLFDMYPRIQGVFNGISDTFDSSRHRVDVGASPGSRVRKTVRTNAQVIKEETIKPAPSPLEFVDLATGQINMSATPGNIGTIHGHRLKYEPTLGDEGIYFLPKGGGAETKVTAVQKNKPGELVFLIPAGLAADDYFLEVRARIQGGTELRTGRLEELITI